MTVHLKNKFGRYAHKDIRHLLFKISVIQTIISLVFGQYVICGSSIILRGS